MTKPERIWLYYEYAWLGSNIQHPSCSAFPDMRTLREFVALQQLRLFDDPSVKTKRMMINFRLEA